MLSTLAARRSRNWVVSSQISVSIVAYREPPSTSTVPNAVEQNRKTMDAAAAILGARRRSVMVANTRAGPAPSTRAASSCRGSSDSHVTPTVRATTAMLKNTRAARIATTDPSNGVSRSRVRNAIPTTTVGSTNGTSTAARSTPRPRNFSLREHVGGRHPEQQRDRRGGRREPDREADDAHRAWSGQHLNDAGRVEYARSGTAPTRRSTPPATRRTLRRTRAVPPPRRGTGPLADR